MVHGFTACGYGGRFGWALAVLVPAEVWQAFAAAAGDPPDLRPLACLYQRRQWWKQRPQRLPQLRGSSLWWKRSKWGWCTVFAHGSRWGNGFMAGSGPMGSKPRGSGNYILEGDRGIYGELGGEEGEVHSNVLEQGDDTEFVLDKALNKAPFYTQFVQVMGGMPEDLEDPTLEQVAAMVKKVKILKQPPYADFAIWLPYAKKHLKTQKYKSFVMMQDGSFITRMVPGPACFQHWLLSFRVLRTTLVMMDQVGLANLMQWENKIEMLNHRYENCWHLIAEADDRGRGEQMAKTFSKVKMAIDAGEPPPRGWDMDKLWQVGLAAGTQRPGLLAGTSSPTSNGVDGKRVQRYSHAPRRGDHQREGEGEEGKFRLDSWRGRSRIQEEQQSSEEGGQEEKMGSGKRRAEILEGGQRKRWKGWRRKAWWSWPRWCWQSRRRRMLRVEQWEWFVWGPASRLPMQRESTETQRKSGDPEKRVPHRLEAGAPLGIERSIQTAGIFPVMEAEEERHQGEWDSDVLLEKGEMKNYKSVEEDREQAEIELNRYMERKFCLAIPRSEAQEKYQGGTISKMGLILKAKDNGEVKRRLAAGCDQAAASHAPEPDGGDLQHRVCIEVADAFTLLPVPPRARWLTTVFYAVLTHTLKEEEKEKEKEPAPGTRNRRAAMKRLLRRINLREVKGADIRLMTDASPEGLGGLLSINGRVLKAFSSPVKPEDREQLGIESSQAFLEALAILVGLRHFASYLRAQRVKFTVQADSVAALALTQKLAAGASSPAMNFIGAELGITLEELEVQEISALHIPGKANVEPGFLSRPSKWKEERMPAGLHGVEIDPVFGRSADFYRLPSAMVEPSLLKMEVLVAGPRVPRTHAARPWGAMALLRGLSNAAGAGGAAVPALLRLLPDAAETEPPADPLAATLGLHQRAGEAEGTPLTSLILAGRIPGRVRTSESHPEEKVRRRSKSESEEEKAESKKKGRSETDEEEYTSQEKEDRDVEEIRDSEASMLDAEMDRALKEAQRKEADTRQKDEDVTRQSIIKVDCKLEHIEGGHHWTAVLDRTFKKCKRGLERGRGPRRKAPEVGAEARLKARSDKKKGKGQIHFARELFEFGRCWMLREADLSVLSTPDVRVDYVSSSIAQVAYLGRAQEIPAQESNGGAALVNTVDASRLEEWKEALQEEVKTMKADMDGSKKKWQKKEKAWAELSKEVHGKLRAKVQSIRQQVVHKNLPPLGWRTACGWSFYGNNFVFVGNECEVTCDKCKGLCA
eukprot:symbB.v1.2.031832.t1/scaffold3739.1/size51156/3